jgi:hypothetical protein
MSKIIFFLYRNDNKIVQYILALMFYILTVFSTFSFVLAKHIFIETIASNSKIAARRLAWYFKRSWIGWSPFPDPFFEAFDVETQPTVFKMQLQILEKAKKRKDDSGWLTWDIMHSEACKVNHMIMNQELDEVQNSINIFSNAAVEILNYEKKDFKIQVMKTGASYVKNFQVKADDALQQFSNLMQKENICWFVIGGTFLGAAREQNFLEHDNDLDIGIYQDEVDPKKLYELLLNSADFISVKFVIRRELSNASGRLHFEVLPAKIIAIHGSGLNFDIFFHQNIDGQIVHGSSHTVWYNSIFKLNNYQLGTQKVLGPHNADKYLTEHYGTWKIEQKEYTCEVDTHNVRYANNFVSLAGHIIRTLKLQTQEISGSDSIKKKLVEQGFFSKSVDKKYSSNLHSIVK